MPRAHIRLPAKLDLASVLAFARELDFYSQHDELTIEMGEQTFFSPFPMLFLAAKLKHFRSRCPQLKLVLKRYQNHMYPAHVGFFRMFGIDHGRDVGEAWGSEDYLPITCLDRETFYTSPSDQFVELPDLIQRHADKIARVITREKPENQNMFDALSYSIREVMRNVFEHSESNSLFYCAQYWPKSNKVEFALTGR